jgi:CheY-like chemotaxis protein
VTNQQILIVDDNPINMKLVHFTLTAAGFEVRTAVDAEEALSTLRAFRPHAILMDLQLPGMDGLELTRRLKARADTRDIVIIALTAYAMKGDDQRALEAGCDAYVSKPIDTQTFPAKIREYIALGTLHRAPGALAAI